MDTNLSCLISRQVVENTYSVGQCVRLNRGNAFYSGWLFLSGDEDEAFFKDFDKNFIEEPLSKIILYNPKIREFLDHPVKSEFLFDEKSGQFTQLKRAWFLGGGAALNPGNVTVNPLVWGLRQPGVLVWMLLGALFAVLAGFAALPGLLIFSAVFLGAALVKCIPAYTQFKHGDACPGIVISVRPTLVAVITDLSMGKGSFPAIKVIPVKMRKVNGRRVEVGMRVPAVALYFHGEETSSHWGSFDPVPVSFATWNNKTFQRVLDSFSEEDWHGLDEGLSQVPKPYKPGLFRVSLKESDWNENAQPENIHDETIYRMAGLIPERFMSQATETPPEVSPEESVSTLALAAMEGTVWFALLQFVLFLIVFLPLIMIAESDYESKQTALTQIHRL